MVPKYGIVILAAGLGTRMKSNKAKVLHEICGRPMIEYVVRTANKIVGPNVVVVVGHQAETVKEVVSRVDHTYFAFQNEQLGTGHAVLCALPEIPDSVEQVIILCGDVPLIRTSTIERLIDDHQTHHRDITILTVRVDNPTGYGRIIADANGTLTAIVEEADANEAQKKINIINTGIYIVSKLYLAQVLPQLRSENAQNEIYLTDIIKLAYEANKTIGTLIGDDCDETIGVNSPAELQLAETSMKYRLI